MWFALAALTLLIIDDLFAGTYNIKVYFVETEINSSEFIFLSFCLISVALQMFRLMIWCDVVGPGCCFVSCHLEGQDLTVRLISFAAHLNLRTCICDMYMLHRT